MAQRNNREILSRKNKVFPEQARPYFKEQSLIHSFENSCLKNECSEENETYQHYCIRNICFSNATFYSLLNGYRIKKIIYNRLEEFFKSLSSDLQEKFMTPISKEDMETQFSFISDQNEKSTFLMYKLMYFMCEKKIKHIFDKSIPENKNQVYHRDLLKIMFDSPLVKSFLTESLKYSVETSWTILTFVLKHLNYKEYTVEPFSILNLPKSSSRFSRKTSPKMLILADSTATNVGISMKNLPLTKTRTLPPKIKYKGSNYSLECGVVFDIDNRYRLNKILQTSGMENVKVPCIGCFPKKFLETPIYGHFEGHYVCRDTTPERNTPDFYNPVNWDNLNIKQMGIKQNDTTYYTWVMYLRIDEANDEPIQPDIRYVYALYARHTKTGEEILIDIYPSLSAAKINKQKYVQLNEHEKASYEYFYEKVIQEKNDV